MCNTFEIVPKCPAPWFFDSRYLKQLRTAKIQKIGKFLIFWYFLVVFGAKILEKTSISIVFWWFFKIFYQKYLQKTWKNKKITKIFNFGYRHLFQVRAVKKIGCWTFGNRLKSVAHFFYRCFLMKVVIYHCFVHIPVAKL